MNTLFNSSPSPATNGLIDRLPETQRKHFVAQCTRIQLRLADALYESDTPIAQVYFPLTGFISRVIAVESSEPLEAGLIGNEGMLGATLALGVKTAPFQSVVHGSGVALTMSATQFRKQLKASAALRRILDEYLFVLIEQLAQNSACNSYHEVRPRLARWLLMTHDRVDGDCLRLTHIFLAGVLGVRRSAVTIAAGQLQARDLISYSRGTIRILSRSGLEAESCECYAATVSAYARRLSNAGQARKDRIAAGTVQP